MNSLTRESVSETFRYSEKHAVNKLGVSVSTFKKFCRVNGIRRWPFRKIRRIETLQDNIKVRFIQLFYGFIYAVIVCKMFVVLF